MKTEMKSPRKSSLGLSRAAQRKKDSREQVGVQG